MSLKLVQDSDPVLHSKCEVFNPRSPDFPLQETIDEMFALMQEKNGIGLAAPQVGINKRMFVMDIDGRKYVCINPSIQKFDKRTNLSEEGCLSYPGIHIAVERSAKVRVTYLDQHGSRKTKSLIGIQARCFQHELDHLDGIVFLDRGETKGVSV